MSEFIESINATLNTVLEKERELLAAGYRQTEKTNELLLESGEYKLRFLDESPVMTITWCKPQLY